MTREIPLTKGFVALVDDADYERVNSFKWRALIRPTGMVYAHCWRIGYMHRLVIGAKAGELVDHRDGDGLRNVRANLRLCTPSQNSMNRRAFRGFKGVVKRGKTYEAKIGLKGKRVVLGNYASEIEAAIAYDAAARLHFGEFARLNFPDGHSLPPLEKEDGKWQANEIGALVTP